jgi:hypothetical protein
MAIAIVRAIAQNLPGTIPLNKPDNAINQARKDESSMPRGNAATCSKFRK